MIEIKLKITPEAFKMINKTIGVQFLSSSYDAVLYEFAKKVIMAIDDGKTEVQIGKHKKGKK